MTSTEGAQASTDEALAEVLAAHDAIESEREDHMVNARRLIEAEEAYGKALGISPLAAGFRAFAVWRQIQLVNGALEWAD